MSEASLPSAASQSDAAPAPLSAGALLRQAREAAGLHVAALAVSMKVPVKKLEALEADRLDLLPDAVFVRALASSVCRALKIDATPVLQRLPQTAVPRLDAEERSINAPFHVSGHSSSLAMPALLARPAVWVVAILLAGAAVLIAFPEVQRLDKDADASASSAASTNAVAMPSQTVLAAEPADTKTVVAVVDTPVVPVPMPVPLAAASAAMEVTAPVAKPAASVAVAKPVVATPPAPAVVAALAPAVAASRPAAATAAIAQPVKMDTSAPAVNLAGAASGLVVFKVLGTSWVEVTDAKGVVQLRKTMAAGETSAASGALPLAVVVGRADITQVEVRGKPFALAGIAKDNVARFEVK